MSIRLADDLKKDALLPKRLLEAQLPSISEAFSIPPPVAPWQSLSFCPNPNAADASVIPTWPNSNIRATPLE